MNEMTSRDVAELSCGALETMAFMVPEVMEEAVQVDTDFHARITYKTDNEKAVLFLSATEGFLRELASSILGVDEDEVEAGVTGVQALTELANVLAGRVAFMLGAEYRLFELGIPEEVDAVPTANQDVQRLECQLDSLGEFLRVVLDRQACPES